MTARWTVVVPVKDTRRGKSRFDLPPQHRSAFVRALALDTLAAVVAAAAVGRVLVAVESAEDGRLLSEIDGVQPHLTQARTLNGALTEAVSTVAGGWVATLPADLPGLSTADLQVALGHASAYDRAVVADREGTGTTLLTARRPDLLHPHYGPDSFRRHLAAGATALGLPPDSTVRRDVDLAADADALGPRSARVWRELAARPDCA